MKKEFIFNVLGFDAFYMVNKKLVKKTSTDAALLLADLIGKHKYFFEKGQLNSDGSFYNTNENIMKDICITDYSLRKAKLLLIEKGLIQIFKKGIPAKNNYIIFYDKIEKLISEK